MEENVKELKVVSIDELKKFANGEVVELPGFTNGETICVRLRRPSLLQMVKAGKVPNELLTDANKLFSKGAGGVVNSQINDPDTLTKMLDLLEVVCEAAFVEPTYAEFKDAGIELTDSQLLAVFDYTQNGVANLKNFH